MEIDERAVLSAGSRAASVGWLTPAAARRGDGINLRQSGGRRGAARGRAGLEDPGFVNQDGLALFAGAGQM